MATLPADPLQIIERFGPHLSTMTGARLSTSVEPDTARQDALLLLRPAVRHPAQGPRQRGDRLRAVGGVPVQPRHALPEGREALPAGLASRSTADGAAARSVGRASGFSPMPYGDAIARVAAEIARLQETHGAGVGRRPRRREPDDREDVPARQVRARVPEDAVHRLQRPALHGERRRGEQEGVRHRPHDQPVVGHGRHRGDLGRRLERRRVLADHHQLHLAGARAGREGHRPGSAHHADRAHLRSVPAGEAGTRRGAVRRRAADDDRARLARSRVHRRRTRSASSRWPSTAAQWTLARTAEVTGVPRARARCRPPSGGARRRRASCFHARGIEHHSNGVQNALGTINLVLASGRIGKPKSGYGTIVGQANGQGGREHGQKCDQLPGLARHHQSRASDATSPASGASTSRTCRAPASMPTSCSARSTPARSRACSSICFNPKVSLPDNAFVTRCLEKLEFYVAIDFFLNDTAWHADIVLPGSLHEEDEGTVTQVEGRVIKINKAVDCPGEAREDWRIIQDIAQALGRPQGLHVRRARARSSRSCASPARAASPTTPASPTRRSTQQMGVFWPCYSEDPRTGAPTPDHPGTPRLFERGQLQPGRQGHRPVLLPRRQGALQRRRLSRAGRRCRARSTRSS